MDIKALRRKNMAELINKLGSQTALADLVGTNRLYISQLLSEKSPRHITDKMARRVEVATGLPAGWIDQEHGETQARNPKNLLAELTDAEVVAMGPDDQLPHGGVFMSYTTVGARSFAYKVVADEVKKVPAGSYVVIDPDLIPENRDIVLVEAAGALFLRELSVRMSGAQMLTATETGVTDEMPKNARIFGVVREVSLRLR